MTGRTVVFQLPAALPALRRIAYVGMLHCPDRQRRFLIATSFVGFLSATCLWLDNTVFTLHMIGFALVMHGIVKINKMILSGIQRAIQKYRMADQTLVSLCLGLLLHSFALWIFSYKGILRIMISLFWIASLLELGYALVGKLLRYLIVAYIGIAFVLFTDVPALRLASSIIVLFAMAGFRRSCQKVESAVVLRVSLQAAMLAPFVLLLLSVCVYWALLSINWLWIDAPKGQWTKFALLKPFGSVLNLGALEVGSVQDLDRLNLIRFPVVIKPSVCTTGSQNTRKCDDNDCLADFVRTRSLDLGSGDTKWVVQRYHPGIEIVVFYYRLQYMRTGFIKTVGIRKRPSQSRSGMLRADYYTSTNNDANFMKTQQLKDFFDRQADKLKGFSGGRFDCVVDNITSARQGKGIHILEVNLLPLEDIHEKIDHGISSFTWFLHYTPAEIRTLLLQLWIGVSNILGGYSGSPWKCFKGVYRLLERAAKCGNMVMLLAAHP